MLVERSKPILGKFLGGRWKNVPPSSRFFLWRSRNSSITYQTRIFGIFLDKIKVVRDFLSHIRSPKATVGVPQGFPSGLVESASRPLFRNPPCSHFSKLVSSLFMSLARGCSGAALSTPITVGGWATSSSSPCSGQSLWLPALAIARTFNALCGAISLLG
jgi:hypothetical protein